MDSLERTLEDNLQTVKDLVPETDPAIDHLVMKGMAMDPRERWKGIEDINTVISCLFSVCYSDLSLCIPLELYSHSEDAERIKTGSRCLKPGNNGIRSAS